MRFAIRQARLPAAFLLFAVAVALATLVSAHDNNFVIEPEFEAVTCGSAIKLAHSATGYRLHSHGINYGSGSGQQSVTGFPGGDDPNIIRLLHMATKKFLHSHSHQSPLSGGQEVSAYEFSDEGGGSAARDNWRVLCQDKKDKAWKREAKVRLQHAISAQYLSSNNKHQFRHPIPAGGRRHTFGRSKRALASTGGNLLWRAELSFQSEAAGDTRGYGVDWVGLGGILSFIFHRFPPSAILLCCETMAAPASALQAIGGTDSIAASMIAWYGFERIRRLERQPRLTGGRGEACMQGEVVVDGRGSQDRSLKGVSHSKRVLLQGKHLQSSLPSLRRPRRSLRRDGQWFKPVRSMDSGDNWVLKFNNLKRIYKLLTGYYEEVLGQNTSGLDVPNLTSIARDSDVLEIVKLMSLIIALAVQCEQNQKYIQQIQLLDAAAQHVLMVTIEQVMTRLGEARVAESPTSAISPFAGEEKLQLENENRLIRQQLEEMKAKFTDMEHEKDLLQSRVRDMEEQSVSQLSGVGKADFLLRTEVDNLKADMWADELAKKTEENTRLKDQLDEFRHFADKLQKSEAMIEKYKKRMEESADLRRQIKLVETQNQQMLERNNQLEEEYRKLSSFKPLMETYKEQIGSMEGKNSALMVENSKLDFELKELKIKLERMDAQRKADADQMQLLEDQVRELELNSSTPVSGGSLGSDLTSSVNTALRARVAQLERDLERASKDDKAERIKSLESALDDATRMKEKFEMDYMQSFQKNLALENEMKQLRSLASSDGQEEVEKLKARIAEYEQELATTKRRLSEAEVAIAQGTGVNSGILPGGADYEKIKRQLDSFEKESRMQMAQINKLLLEKDMLETANQEMKESVLQQERTNNDLKAALAAFESKGQSSDETTQKLASATQKVVQLTEQNNKLHKALKEAKKHILSQDKQIKDRIALAEKDNFIEAITSFETSIREKDAELERLKKEVLDTRNAARREQALMVTAWHDLGMQFQRRSMQQRNDGSSFSWLSQQRKKCGGLYTPKTNHKRVAARSERTGFINRYAGEFIVTEFHFEESKCTEGFSLSLSLTS
ncbi:hypothetical protein DFJ73DRAFT_757870 [Zopfochytrium polystomum]|nr:hypothetical protein DFJ73DRAFT_757870 [Zopfochytrium polystomum]